MEKTELWANKFLELAKNWPFLLFILLLCFKKEIQGLIANSQSITIGQLSIKVKEDILQRPSAKVRKVLPRLAADDIQFLLQDFNMQVDFTMASPSTIAVVTGPNGATSWRRPTDTCSTLDCTGSSHEQRVSRPIWST
jgi:hypothetical protein